MIFMVAPIWWGYLAVSVFCLATCTGTASFFLHFGPMWPLIGSGFISGDPQRTHLGVRTSPIAAAASCSSASRTTAGIRVSVAFGKLGFLPCQDLSQAITHMTADGKPAGPRLRHPPAVNGLDGQAIPSCQVLGGKHPLSY